MCDDDGCSGSEIYIFQVLKEEMNFRKKPLDKFKIFTKIRKECIVNGNSYPSCYRSLGSL